MGGKALRSFKPSSSDTFWASNAATGSSNSGGGGVQLRKERRKTQEGNMAKGSRKPAKTTEALQDHHI